MVRRGDCAPAGCVIGNSEAADRGRSPMLAGGWSGKCFLDLERGYPTRALNILTPNAADLDWSEGVSGTLGLEGAIYQAPAWQDGTPAVILDYTDIPRSESLIMDFNNFRDELKWVAPGMMIGQIWMKPGTGMNPMGRPMPTGVWFAAFQVLTAAARLRVAAGAAVFGGGAFGAFPGFEGFEADGDFSIPAFMGDFFGGGGGGGGFLPSTSPCGSLPARVFGGGAFGAFPGFEGFEADGDFSIP
eukprot:jgi/Tetstr1/430721/TSEL_020512.t1